MLYFILLKISKYYHFQHSINIKILHEILCFLSYEVCEVKCLFYTYSLLLFRQVPLHMLASPVFLREERLESEKACHWVRVRTDEKDTDGDIRTVRCDVRLLPLEVRRFPEWPHYVTEDVQFSTQI